LEVKTPRRIESAIILDGEAKGETKARQFQGGQPKMAVPLGRAGLDRSMLTVYSE
jgi:hypothetical protein